MGEPILTPYLLYAIDLVAISVLVFGVFYRRHRRRDLVVAYLGVNVGILAIATVLVNSELAAGLGLGLFGILSIIRLRSAQLSQDEVAYYFAALALGLLGGLGTMAGWAGVGASALIVAVLAVVDHPRFLARSHNQVIKLDQAITDRGTLLARLTDLTGGRITQAKVLQLDLKHQTTTVDVRFEVPK